MLIYTRLILIVIILLSISNVVEGIAITSIGKPTAVYYGIMNVLTSSFFLWLAYTNLQDVQDCVDVMPVINSATNTQAT